MKLKVGDFAKFAREDLEQMEYNATNGFRPAGTTCMHAQQYVEKMLKDKIVELYNAEPEKTHNLRVLLAAIVPDDSEMDQDIVMKVGILSDYYMATRYPDCGGLDEMDEETAEEAYHWAMEIVEYVRSIQRDDEGNVVIGNIAE